MIPRLAGANWNISDDPLFCDTAGSNFTLDALSPCSPYNNACHTLFGSESLGCTDLCGDCNASGFVDIDDVVYLINYIFIGGPPPNPLEVGDTNCSGFVDIDDVVYLINYIFNGGPSPGC